MPRIPSPALPEGPGFNGFEQRTDLPLSGLTMLAVEDSRFASEALRLLCHRSGARLRRVETIAAARRHLAVYRPDVVIVDLGLPDGPGVDLIRELTQPGPYEGLVLAISGDPDGWSAAVRAGAAGFLEKPVESLAGFQRIILGHLGGQPVAGAGGAGSIRPDRQALQDDLRHAVAMIGQARDGQQRYVADFVKGIARSCHDLRLEGAARDAPGSDTAMANLSAALNKRLRHAPDPFATSADGKI